MSSNQSQSSGIYLDYNGTTPIAPEALHEVTECLQHAWGNPSSNHTAGKFARTKLEEARTRVAQLIECEPEEIIFTSGATESINWAIKGAVEATHVCETCDKAVTRKPHVITLSIEHPAGIESCKWIEQRGLADVTYLPVDSCGLVQVEDVVNAVCPETCLISIMHANNEVGTIQPIREIVDAVKTKFPEQKIAFHSDASQSIGKVDVSVAKLGVDMLTVAGHKFYGPKGVGALVITRTCPLRPAKFIHGAGQEKGARAGTENVAYAAGMGRAAQIAAQFLHEGGSKQFVEKRDYLQQSLITELQKVGQSAVVHGPSESSLRLPNTLSIAIPNVAAVDILNELHGHVAASAGSACKSSKKVYSHVLAAMGIPAEVALGTLRLSIGRSTTTDQLDQATQHIVKAVEKLV